MEISPSQKNLPVPPPGFTLTLRVGHPSSSEENPNNNITEARGKIGEGRSRSSSPEATAAVAGVGSTAEGISPHINTKADDAKASLEKAQHVLREIKALLDSLENGDYRFDVVPLNDRYGLSTFFNKLTNYIRDNDKDLKNIVQEAKECLEKIKANIEAAKKAPLVSSMPKSEVLQHQVISEAVQGTENNPPLLVDFLKKRVEKVHEFFRKNPFIHDLNPNAVMKLEELNRLIVQLKDANKIQSEEAATELKEALNEAEAFISSFPKACPDFPWVF